jgi:hypothetical protein
MGAAAAAAAALSNAATIKDKLQSAATITKNQELCISLSASLRKLKNEKIGDFHVDFHPPASLVFLFF